VVKLLLDEDIKLELEQFKIVKSELEELEKYGMPKSETRKRLEEEFGPALMNDILMLDIEMNKEKILQKIASNRKEDTLQGYEMIVDLIKDHNSIYSLRNDDKSEMWIYNDGIYVPQAKSYIKELCRQILGDAYTTYICNNVISRIEADTFVEEDVFFSNTNPEEICVENGILNIKTRELSDFTPEKIFFNKIPVEYNPNAECDAIEKFLLDVLKDESDLPIMYEIFGYLLLREYKFEKAFMFLGSGRNGKGKTIELMKRFLGPDNCTNIPIQQLETDKFAVGVLHNKMANLSADINSKALKNTGVFKSLTGRDLISAERKFLPRIHFVNYAKMIFCANTLPRTYDFTPAFFKRWILLEFPYTFVSEKEHSIAEDKTYLKIKDAEIIDKIATREEMSGLLNKALDGLDSLLENNDFSYSKTSKEVEIMWIRKSDSFAAFVMDRIEKDRNSWITKEDLREEYYQYCKENDVDDVSDKSIKATLSSMGVTDSRMLIGDAQTYCWNGIRLKNNQ